MHRSLREITGDLCEVDNVSNLIWQAYSREVDTFFSKASTNFWLEMRRPTVTALQIHSPNGLNASTDGGREWSGVTLLSF